MVSMEPLPKLPKKASLRRSLPRSLSFSIYLLVDRTSLKRFDTGADVLMRNCSNDLVFRLIHAQAMPARLLFSARRARDGSLVIVTAAERRNQYSAKRSSYSWLLI
jgi:hypothetical protein